MTITIAETDDTTTFSIDLLRHNTSGERFVVKYLADWDGENCVGGHVEYAAGPLTDGEVAGLYAEPFNWDADPEIEIVNDDYTWEEIYAGHR